MKKIIILIIITSTVFISGCEKLNSTVESVNVNSVGSDKNSQENIINKQNTSQSSENVKIIEKIIVVTSQASPNISSVAENSTAELRHQLQAANKRYEELQVELTDLNNIYMAKKDVIRDTYEPMFMDNKITVEEFQGYLTAWKAEYDKESKPILDEATELVKKIKDLDYQIQYIEDSKR